MNENDKMNKTSERIFPGLPPVLVDALGVDKFCLLDSFEMKIYSVNGCATHTRTHTLNARETIRMELRVFEM